MIQDKTKKNKNLKIEVILDDKGNKIIEISYKIGSNNIKTDMTLEVIKSFKDYLFLNSEESEFILKFEKGDTKNDTAE